MLKLDHSSIQLGIREIQYFLLPEFASMAVSKAPSTSFNVPTVDLAPYLADPTSTEALKTIHQVRDACTNTGFFQLIGHEIPRSLQDEVFEGSAALFKLPFEEKKKLDKSESVGASNRGYELIGNQGLQEGTLPDLKEVSPMCLRISKT